MTLRKTIPLDIYDCKVTLLVCDNLPATTKRVARRLGVSVDTSEEDGGYSLYSEDNAYDYYLLLSTHLLAHSTIGHEIWHTTGAVLENRGYVLKWDSEPAAYLCGFITKHVYDFLITKGVVVS